ncbi:unnamed protein product [Heligmosomoides polygyrus]|uniref:Uncharacterized protein n=1 Tax=Heligmosomoides polygyrus TaxID=6339 RepID=A0A183G7U1_HELPZ|nr:unnamed protein product [Heligmosomoides polygyrus]
MSRGDERWRERDQAETDSTTSATDVARTLDGTKKSVSCRKLCGVVTYGNWIQLANGRELLPVNDYAS